MDVSDFSEKTADFEGLRGAAETLCKIGRNEKLAFNTDASFNSGKALEMHGFG